VILGRPAGWFLFFSLQVPAAFCVKGKTFSRHEAAHYFLSTSFFDLNSLHPGDWTPLHLATFLGLVDFVEMLLFFKAKVDVPDRLGVTPIHLAIQAGDIEIVQCLLRAGSNVKSSPIALNLAVGYGNIEIVTLLLKYGANPELKNRAGKTSFDLLQRPEQKDIEEIMRTIKEVERPRVKAPAQIAPGVKTFGDLFDRMPRPPPERVGPTYTVTRI
jgi:ankyrin repeat protein